MSTKPKYDSMWVYFGAPVSVVAIHNTSKAALRGLASSWDKKGNKFYIGFDLTEEYVFSSVTGVGRGAVRAWRLSEQSFRALTGSPEAVMKDPPPRRPRKPRKAPAADPRQERIECT